MTSEVSNLISMWIFLPSLGLTLLVVATTAVGSRRGIRTRRKNEQITRLRSATTDKHERAQNIEINWLNYREIPKAELISMLGKNGWEYREESVEDNVWLLRFTFRPAQAHKKSQDTTATRRIATELNSAEPDSRGQYRLDTSQYGEMTPSDMHAAVTAAGWVVVGSDHASGGTMLLLSYPGTTVLNSLDGPFVSDQQTAHRQQERKPTTHPEGRKEEAEHDPLSPMQLNWARTRHKHWAKQFNRQVGLAFFYGIFGLIILLGTFASFEPADGSRFYMMLAAAVLMLLLLGTAAFKAVLVRRKRRAELGEFLDAHNGLIMPTDATDASRS